MNAEHTLIALGTIVRREVMRILRIWTQTLLPPAITVTLYFIIFGSLIGRRIGEIAPGISYIEYIAPGLIMMSVIQNAYGNITSSFFGAKFQRFVEEMLVSPMPSWTILTGYIAGAVLRGFMVGVIVLGISLFFTKIHLYHPLITLSTFVLAATIFGMLGFINAIFARKFDDIAIIPTFVLTPLTYLGGVFYNVAQLPSPWKEISHLNPILYMVSAFRYGLLGISDINLAWAYAVMLAFVLALGAFCLSLLQRGVGLRS
ncbi:MAG: ABC transporter permease [Xanthomonadaceae bacterium]|nr:ABC transporter permease [Xanthomonadaceae bacterium]MDE1884798.1 ABC transporter permease [Xanthomonadaceae bacterium]MDE1960706.1 ABC transporter permease [Xanthomonadaceae bacterium]MDE2083540.1 ABC transporter permease [Xanthomonadaceae bacterium]MDE2258520.1 ABC transporter permease [Xanthomonadaceae bacterium]